MIELIEVWDFESHEHTILKDISSGLNLLCGESNSGKTSLIRALKLVAYNQFDTKSIRIGCKKCVVFVKTHRGTVKVTRGPKDNLWEVTKNGQPTLYLDKVGVNVVPQAAEVLGLNIITLGDVDVPVNIMDQHESHFMLSGIGNKEASGSMRAQIVDEISGLSGIESLIKDVSLDYRRFGIEIRETEEKMEEVRKQLHPESDLDSEQTLLDGVEKEMMDYDELGELATTGKKIVADVSNIDGSIAVLDVRSSKIPDLKIIAENLVLVEKGLRKSLEASKTNKEGSGIKKRLEEVDSILVLMPDFKKAEEFVRYAEVLLKSLESGRDLNSKFVQTVRSIDSKDSRLAEILRFTVSKEDMDTAGDILSVLPQIKNVLKSWNVVCADLEKKELRNDQIREGLKAKAYIDLADEVICRLNKLGAMCSDLNAVEIRLMYLTSREKSKNAELDGAKKELEEVLSEVKTCPLTLRPVSKECLEEARK